MAGRLFGGAAPETSERYAGIGTERRGQGPAASEPRAVARRESLQVILESSAPQIREVRESARRRREGGSSSSGFADPRETPLRAVARAEPQVRPNVEGADAGITMRFPVPLTTLRYVRSTEARRLRFGVW